MALNRIRRDRHVTPSVRAASYPAVMPLASLSTHHVVDGTVDNRVDPSKPSLRADYRVPQHGAGRRTALDEGLSPPWRVHAAHDAPERLRTESSADAFSVHLLTNDASWAVLVLTNSQWIGGRDRHTLLADSLATALSAPTLGGLVGHFTGEASPMTLPRVRERGRLDVLDLLLRCEHPDRASVEFMVALSGLSTRIEEWREQRGHVSQQRRLSTLEEALATVLEERGLYRPDRLSAIRKDLTQTLGTHWDASTHTPAATYVPAVREVLHRHLSNTLDGVLDDLIVRHLDPA